jgi:DNA-binding PucR family transcriptional regulator
MDFNFEQGEFQEIEREVRSKELPLYIIFAIVFLGIFIFTFVCDWFRRFTDPVRIERAAEERAAEKRRREAKYKYAYD